MYNDNPPYTHNLAYLAKRCKIYEEFSEERKDFLDILGPLNIEVRYPTYKRKLLMSLNAEKCQDIINDIINKTEELYQWIKNKLSK